MLNNIDLNTVTYKITQLAFTENAPKIYISGPVSMYKDDNYALSATHYLSKWACHTTMCCRRLGH